MLSLLVEDKDLTIKDVDKNELTKIIDWLSSDNSQQYKYAMGIDEPITARDLYEKYFEVLINTHEFFLSINLQGDLIGFVKGRTDYRNKGEIWLMSLLIDITYQNKGIGTRVLKLIMNEFNEKFGIKDFYACLVDNNISGEVFWRRNGFNICRITKDYFTIDNKSCDLIIMYREL